MCHAARPGIVNGRGRLGATPQGDSSHSDSLAWLTLMREFPQDSTCEAPYKIHHILKLFAEAFVTRTSINQYNEAWYLNTFHSIFELNNRA